MGLKESVEKMSIKKLELMRRKAFTLQGVEHNMAMFAYHEQAAEFWDEQWGNSVYDDKICTNKWQKHCKERDKYYNKIQWRCSDEV